jgi:hypothetical protein
MASVKRLAASKPVRRRKEVACTLAQTYRKALENEAEAQRKAKQAAKAAKAKGR